MELRTIAPEGALYQSELELRFRILREPLGHDRDSVRFAFEADSVHVVAVEANTVVGCVLFQPDGQGGGRLYQMAVGQWLQGQGIGSQLVRFLEAALAEQNIERIELHARDTAVPFYAKLGYRCVGEPFEEVGLPHRIMEKSLGS